MSITIVLPQELFEDIESKARLSLETAGVLLASVVSTSRDGIRLLGRKMMWVDQSAYDRREQDGLSITSVGYVHALGQAEDLHATALWIHTHPGIDADPLPSEHDKIVDRQIADLFRLRAASQYYGAVVFSPREEALTFAGHIEFPDGHRERLERIWVVGGRFRLVHAFDSRLPELSPIFDRNIRAFGGAIQTTLANLHVGIVGCGGTGSAVAEQLTRLGVKTLTLVDPEVLSTSNVTRVYGSTPNDVGTPKVDILANHLKRIAPESEVETVRGMITTERIAKRVVGCDVVFGCTDDNAGRLVLSRLATYMLLPVIDCGVVLTNDEHLRLTGIDGRVTVLTPGQACLVCRGRVDLARASAELLTPEERTRRQDEGYAPALGRVEPAVVTFTTIVGATAVNELLERLVGYGPAERPSEIILRFHEREISTNTQNPRSKHYCHSRSEKLGVGETAPFLEQTWPD